MESLSEGMQPGIPFKAPEPSVDAVGTQAASENCSLAAVGAAEKTMHDYFLAAAKGDERAFEEIARLSLPYISRLVCAKTPALDPIDREEIVQAVFISAWQSIGQLKLSEARQSGEGWLARIAYRRIVDHFRSRNRGGISFVALPENDVAADALLPLVDSAETTTMGRLFEEEVLGLFGEQDKKALLLIMAGAEKGEIAKALGMGPNATEVSQRVCIHRFKARAREVIRQALAAEE